MPDRKIVPWYRHIPLDASLAIPSTGMHLFALNDGQRYIVRRLLDYAHREEQYAVQWNTDGTYTTPSAAQLDDIFENVDRLEDELMGTLTYSQGTQVVEMLTDGGGSIALNNAWKTLAWVRVGNVVHLSGRLVVASAISPAGELFVDDLPFPVAVGNAYYTAPTICAGGLVSGATTALQGAFAAGMDSLYIYRFENGNVVSVANKVTAGSVFILGGSYITDAE